MTSYSQFVTKTEIKRTINPALKKAGYNPYPDTEGAYLMNILNHYQTNPEAQQLLEKLNKDYLRWKNAS